MNMIDVTKLLGQALREKKAWIEVSPGGRGCYDFSYDPTYEIEVDGHTLRLSDEWCGESQNSGYCYRQHLSVDGADGGELAFSCRVARLNGVAYKLLDKIPFGNDAAIARAAGVEDVI